MGTKDPPGTVRGVIGTEDPPGTVRGVIGTEDPPGTVRDVMGTELSNDVPRTNETPAKELDAAVFLKIIRVYGLNHSSEHFHGSTEFPIQNLSQIGP